MIRGCDGDPSAQTLVDMGVREMFQELEEVPVTMVGGLDVHRQQITFRLCGRRRAGALGSDLPGNAEDVARLAG